MPDPDKRVERVASILSFPSRGMKVQAHGVRQEVPSCLGSITCSLAAAMLGRKAAA